MRCAIALWPGAPRTAQRAGHANRGATDELVERLADTEALIVLGGDGTFLRAARALAAVDVPVLGVNSGRIGFLSKIEPEALETTLAESARRRATRSRHG